MPVRLPFASIRSKLIAAFVAVIALSLLLASSAFAYLLADYQAERERDRLQEIAMVYRGQVSAALRAGLSVQEIGTQLEQVVGDSGVRGRSSRWSTAACGWRSLLPSSR